MKKSSIHSLQNDSSFAISCFLVLLGGGSNLQVAGHRLQVIVSPIQKVS